MRSIVFQAGAFEDFGAWARDDSGAFEKLRRLIFETAREPFIGIGKPEPLSLQAQLNAAIAGTANNIPGLSPLNLTINNNPPQQWEVQPIADKVDELINSLRR